MPGWARWGASPQLPVAAPSDKQVLESQAGALRQQLDQIEQRLKDLGDNSED